MHGHICNLRTALKGIRGYVLMSLHKGQGIKNVA